MKNIITKTFLLIVMFYTSSSISQTINGNVTDQSGIPMVGVSVLEKGTSNGTITDFDGNYSISLTQKEPELVFSYVGFETQTIKANNINTINVQLKQNIETLGGIIINAIGFKEDRDELGYASSKIEGESVNESTQPSLINSLAGRASGVRITNNSGDPGAGSYIQIRGASTITRNSQPLIIVDGVPISNDVRGNRDGGYSEQSRLNDINPNDIESVSVLKGASAAALWGTKALGGVIVIKTKSGQFNKPLTITYKSTYSYDEINKKYPLQNKYGQGDNGIYNPRARDSWGDLISDRSGGNDEFDTSGEYYVDQNGRVYYPILSKNSRQTFNDSNFDQIFDNGYFFENNLSISGGNEKSTMFLSIGDLNQQGIIKKNSDYRRTTARFNAQHKFTDAIRLKLNTNYTHTTSNRILKGASSSGLYLGLLRNPADFDISGYRGDYYAAADAAAVPNRQRSYREPLGADDSATYNNPLWTTNEQESLAKVNRIISNFEFNADPVSWLSLITRVGVDHYSENKSEFFTPGSASGAYRSGFLDLNLATNTIFNADFIAKSSVDINNDWGGTLLAGFNYNSRTSEVNGNSATNFVQFVDVDSGIRDIDNSLPENRSVTSIQGRERTAAFYSSLSLSAYDMFFLNTTLRVESASTFGDIADNKFLFPSASLAWQFSELLDLQDSFFSFGKLRTSYGEVGVQPLRYQTRNVYVSPSLGDTYGGNLDLSLYGNGGFVPAASRGNQNLKPERKKETEVGLDLRFFKNRLSLSSTYFHNVTDDVLLDLPLANSTGYGNIYTNAAQIQNNGLELELGYDIFRNDDFSWNMNANFTTVKNEVTDLAGVESITLGGLSAVNSRAIEGEPLGVLWGSRSLRDENGDVVLDENGFPVQDQNEGIIGDPNPDWQGGLTNTITYKKFSFSFLIETYQGADIYAGTKSVLRDLGTWGDTANESVASQPLNDYEGNIIPAGQSFRGNIQDFGAGPVALTEAWYNGDGGYFGGGNDELYIEDGSWTRLRQVRLSYLLKNNWLEKKLNLDSVEFSITGRNLILWTNFEGNDPDTNLSGVSKARGIDYFNNPSTKSYVFSLLLTL